MQRKNLSLVWPLPSGTFTITVPPGEIWHIISIRVLSRANSTVTPRDIAIQQCDGVPSSLFSQSASLENTNLLTLDSAVYHENGNILLTLMPDASPFDSTSEDGVTVFSLRPIISPMFPGYTVTLYGNGADPVAYISLHYFVESYQR
jgi:hypothetical protein